jgi:hypothetical protein
LGTKPLPTPDKLVGGLETKPLSTPDKLVGGLGTKPLPTPDKLVGGLETKPLSTPDKLVGGLGTKPLHNDRPLLFQQPIDQLSRINLDQIDSGIALWHRLAQPIACDRLIHSLSHPLLKVLPGGSRLVRLKPLLRTGDRFLSAAKQVNGRGRAIFPAVPRPIPGKMSRVPPTQRDYASRMALDVRVI